MSVSSRFEQFIDNIKPTTAQLEDAATKYHGVCEKLHDYFYPDDYYDGSTKLLIGSYGKNTNVRPARDVDVIFKMPWDEYIESSSTYNVQSRLLQRVKNILEEKYPDTDIKGDGPVVVVNFSNEHFIEVVPAFEFSDSGQFFIPDTSEGGSWKLVDPRAEISQVSNSDSRSDGNTRNLIRMLKKWQDTCSVPIKSLVLELRAINFLKNYEYYDRSSMYYDWMIRDYFSELPDYVNGSCLMPGLEERIHYGDEWESKARTAYLRACKACKYEADEDEYDATVEWKKIFGDDFWY